MSSSVHANNKTKDILILGKEQTKGLDNISLRGEVSAGSPKNRFFRRILILFHLLVQKI